MSETSEIIPSFTSRAKIERAKEIYGPVQTIEIQADSLANAHRQLGEAVKEPLLKYLGHKLKKYDVEKWQREQQLATGFLAHLDSKKDDPFIGRQVKDYLESIAAWADGAGIVKAVKEIRPDLSVNSAIELALQFQNDNTGCITAMVPTKDGSVYVLHTEEAEKIYKSSADKSRIAAMKINSKTYYNFIYTDLLPGGAFSWDDEGRFMAVDALYLKEGQPKALANTVAWILMFSENGFKEAEKIIKALGPYYDGYVINLVEKGEAKKIIFAHDQQENIPIDREHVAHQANLILEDSPLKNLEQIDLDDKEGYLRRIKLLNRLVLRFKSKINLLTLDYLTRLLSFRIAGEDGIVSGGWVKGGVAAKIGPDQSEVRVIAGPTLRKDTKEQTKNYQSFKDTY